MQASAVKQKLEGAYTFLSKLGWNKEMKNILINGISKKPSFQWNCTVASFCDQLYILDWISQLVFFLLIKTIPTEVPHVHALICQTPVFSAHIKVVSTSSSHALHGLWLLKMAECLSLIQGAPLGGYTCLSYSNAGTYSMLSCNVHPK